MRSIDLNADLGEGFGRWLLGDDDALLESMPEVLDRMFDRIEEKLAELPE